MLLDKGLQDFHSDVTQYEPGQTVPVTPYADYNYAIGQGPNVRFIGPKFFNIVKNNLAALNPSYIAQLPTKIKNVTENIDWTQQYQNALGLDNIDAFELGNEPGFWGGTVTILHFTELRGNRGQSYRKFNSNTTKVWLLSASLSVLRPLNLEHRKPSFKI